MNERLIKLDDQNMATFLVILMQALFYTHLGNSLIHFDAFSATLLAKCVALLPVTCLLNAANATVISVVCYHSMKLAAKILMEKSCF